MVETKQLTPETAPEAAAHAVDEAPRVFHFDLDYSPQSLLTIDPLLQRFHDEKKKSHDMPGLVATFGCYLGEVIIRHLGGSWQAGDGVATSMPVLVKLSDDVVCNPLGKVAKRIDNGEEDSLVSFFTSLKRVREQHIPEMGLKPVPSSPPKTEDSSQESAGRAVGLNWPTNPTPDGKVPPLIQVLGGGGPEGMQAVYLMHAVRQLKSEGWEPVEFQSIGDGPLGYFSIPCVAKRGDEAILIFSHTGEWKAADIHRFVRWSQVIRISQINRVPILIVHDHDPSPLVQSDLVGERFGIRLAHVNFHGPSGNGATASTRETQGAPSLGHEPQQTHGSPHPDVAPTTKIGGEPFETRARTICYAGFWSRAVAKVIDTFVLTLLWFGESAIVVGILEASKSLKEVAQTFEPVILILGWVMMLFGPLAYYTLMESSKTQATLGKRALGLQVTDLQGRRISFGHALGRFLAKTFSWITFGFGFVMAGFTPRKQALHDFIASTLVIRTG